MSAPAPDKAPVHRQEGHPLPARLEMCVPLEERLRRFPDVRLAGPPERVRSDVVSGIARLPVHRR